MPMRASFNVHGATWEQYDALPSREEHSTGNWPCRWKRLAFGRPGQQLELTVHEPEEPRDNWPAVTPGAWCGEYEPAPERGA